MNKTKYNVRKKSVRAKLDVEMLSGDPALKKNKKDTLFVSNEVGRSLRIQLVFVLKCEYLDTDRSLIAYTRTKPQTCLNNW